MAKKKYEKKVVVETVEPEVETPQSITVDTGALNVREDFCMDSRVLKVIHNGETYPVLESSKEWWKIQAGDIVGWCRKEFTR